MKKLIENIKNLWKSSWKHTTSIFFTFSFTFFGNVYNFMTFRDVMWNQIKGSQYVVQVLLCGIITYIVAYSVELYQLNKGANKTEFLWIKNARPDIWVGTVFGILGCIIAQIVYVTNY